MEILEELAPFNEEHRLEGGGIRVKLAIHKGYARYGEKTGRIYSKAIHSVSHLESEASPPDTISISHPVYKELDLEQRNQFAPQGVFDEMEIYRYKE
jgi:class 3 adenylate cyclase